MQLKKLLTQTPSVLINKKIKIVSLLSIIVMLILNLIRIRDFMIDPNNQGLPLIFTFTLLILFGFIYFLAYKNKNRLSAWLLIIIYAAPTILCFYYWGADLPAALLLSILIIMLAGIFLGGREAFSVSLIFSAAIILFSYLQTQNILTVSSNWRQEPHQLADAIAYVVIGAIIFFLAWLSAVESRESLKKAQQAQQELKLERDQLEIKVAARTKEILNIKREKMEQLQALASIGKLSGGIFHDIINPLTVVNLNLEQMKNNNCSNIPTTKDYIHQALNASQRIQELIEAANRSLRQQQKISTFSVCEETKHIMKIMSVKARMKNTQIKIDCQEDSFITGDNIKFGQVMMNLISNAIDAGKDQNNQVTILIKKLRPEQILEISVQDQGEGILEGDKNKIFQTFFSTKTDNNHSGLGLSISKEIIEQEFKGTISFTSQINKGTCFYVKIPTKI
jgi:signal transduction histidine kinase